MLDKIATVEKFNPEEYVKNYLDDFKTPLTPLTYKGCRLPVWLIKELMTEDELKAKRKIALTKDIITNEILVKQGETVEDFINKRK